MAANKATNDAPAFNLRDSKHIRKATINDLGREDYLAAYTGALARVMSTDVARSTYAQIVDGAPLSQTMS